MSQIPINQKEYLKKYLLSKDSKKKKKKPVSKSVKIIDDDDMNPDVVDLIGPDGFDTNEDAPQIVAIIDDRPHSMKIDEKTKDNLWRPLGAITEQSSEKLIVNKFKINKLGTTSLIDNQSRRELTKKLKSHKSSSPSRSISSNNSSSHNKRQRPDSEEEKNQLRYGSEGSPPRRSRAAEDDLSPRRIKSESPDISPRRRRSESSDISPPRKRSVEKSKRQEDDDFSPTRKRPKDKYDSSPSQNRKRKNSSSSDQSPPRRKAKDSEDNSPLRNRKRKNSSSSSDQSPPRKRAVADSSPPRNRRQRNFSLDQSPPRRNKKKDSNFSPKHFKRGSPGRCSNNDSSERSKMKKTLDGKMAGLQNAFELARELKDFKKREEQHSKLLSAEESGVNAKVVYRDRKTGKVRNLEQEAIDQQKKEEEENKRKEKYDRWGRGLKQVEDSAKRAAEMLHEMNKPLARYADDEDLERHLKEQEREGDPMLAYIRQKKRQSAKDQPNYSEKPEYQGEFHPNRYGIKPGHRWDGVDRSNGFERRYFEEQNKKKASRDEMLAWSTEDM